MTLSIDWQKMQGLVPAVIQHSGSGQVLMLGYMNEAALAATQASGRVTFFSRSKKRLWTKGEESGHFLALKHIAMDCDADTLLILAEPHGPVCHLGTVSCFGADAPLPEAAGLSFLSDLEGIIEERLEAKSADSYTARLAEMGVRHIAQKVGEEGLELALAAVAQGNQEVIDEAADLLFHSLLLLKVKGLSLTLVAKRLAERHAQKSGSAH